MKGSTITIIILSIIVLGGILFFAYNYQQSKCNIQIYNKTTIAYNQGAYDLIKQINSQGKVPVIQNKTINWIDIKTICGVKQ